MSLFPEILRATTAQALEDAVTHYIQQSNDRDYHILALLYKEAEEQSLVIHLASAGFGAMRLRAQELLAIRAKTRET